MTVAGVVAVTVQDEGCPLTLTVTGPAKLCDWIVIVYVVVVPRRVDGLAGVTEAVKPGSVSVGLSLQAAMAMSARSGSRIRREICRIVIPFRGWSVLRSMSEARSTVQRWCSKGGQARVLPKRRPVSSKPIR